MNAQARMVLPGALLLGLVLTWRTASAAPAGDLTAAEIAAAQQLSEQISTVE